MALPNKTAKLNVVDDKLSRIQDNLSGAIDATLDFLNACFSYNTKTGLITALKNLTVKGALSATSATVQNLTVTGTATGVGVTYPLAAPNGTLAAPSYNFASSPGSGMFWDAGTSKLKLTNAGNLSAQFASNGDVNVSGSCSAVSFTSTVGTNSFGGTATNFTGSSTVNFSNPQTYFSSNVALNGSGVLNVGTFAGAGAPTNYITDGVSARLSFGTGAPTYTAGKGSIFMRTDGGAGSTMYINETGGGTWRAV